MLRVKWQLLCNLAYDHIWFNTRSFLIRSVLPIDNVVICPLVTDYAIFCFV